MTSHTGRHGTGDRNNDQLAEKDAEIHRKRDRENWQSDRKRDRADESRTGNHEPPSQGDGVP